MYGLIDSYHCYYYIIINCRWSCRAGNGDSPLCTIHNLLKAQGKLFHSEYYYAIVIERVTWMNQQRWLRLSNHSCLSQLLMLSQQQQWILTFSYNRIKQCHKLNEDHTHHNKLHGWLVKILSSTDVHRTIPVKQVILVNQVLNTKI